MFTRPLANEWHIGRFGGEPNWAALYVFFIGVLYQHYTPFGKGCQEIFLGSVSMAALSKKILAYFIVAWYNKLKSNRKAVGIKQAKRNNRLPLPRAVISSCEETYLRNF